MAQFVQGSYGQLHLMAAPPTAGTMLTADGWQDSQFYMESLIALAPGSGTADVAIGTTYQAAHIGALSLSGGGAFEQTATATNNEVRYIGVPSGENRFKLEAILTCTAAADAKELIVCFYKNGVELTCADTISDTKVTGRTVSVQGCGVLAVNDVIAIMNKSADGAVVTISKARLVITQIA